MISRAGFDVENIIYENDILWNHRKNIFVIKDQFENQISSRKIRKAVARGQSVKYLVNDTVERYIHTHGLYTTLEMFVYNGSFQISSKSSNGVGEILVLLVHSSAKIVSVHASYF